MSTTVIPPAGPVGVPVTRRRRGALLGPVGTASAVVLGLLVLVALFAPVLAPQDPLVQDLTAINLPPGSPEHLLGTDALGRDLLSRFLHGARTPLLVGVLAVLAGGIVGVSLGVAAGYLGGAVDQVLSRLADIQLAIPSILLALMILAFGGRGLVNLVVVIAITGWPIYFRICRSAVLSLRGRAYIESAVISGGSRFYVMSRHLVRAVAPFAVVTATLDLSRAVLLEAGLSFLGLGVQPPTPDWGLMVAEGQRQILQGVWWLSVFPGLGLAVLVLAVNLLGDRLSDVLTPGASDEGGR